MSTLRTITCVAGITITIAIITSIIGGCHGGGAGVAKAGRLTVSMVWPEASRDAMQTQLIPARSESVQVVIFNGSETVGEELLVRPTSPPWTTEASFSPLPATTLLVQATAYPNNDGTGTPQAAAEMSVIVEPGQSGYPASGDPGDPVILILESTITTVAVTPDPVQVGVGHKRQMTATALDSESRAVLIPVTDPFAWAITTGGSFATVDSNGLVTGTTVGTATVQATETESGIAGTATVNVAAAESGYMFVTKWGGGGSGDGKFGSTTQVDIHVDVTGNVYASDPNNKRIQKFDNAGNFLLNWGTEGTGDGQFILPRDITTDVDGNVYVVDQKNHYIQVFTNVGVFIRKWALVGYGGGEFDGPVSIDLDGSSNVYVLDRGNHRVQKFTNNGTFIAEWGSRGAGDSQFEYPRALAVDKATNDVFVHDVRNYRVQKFTNNGTFITKWGSQGTGDGQFENYNSSGIAVDTTGKVFIPDTFNHRIQKFTGSGAFLLKWGSQGAAPGQLEAPVTVDVDIEGNVYIYSNYFIHKFRPMRGDIGFIIN
jgi:hypothetical protein